MADNTPNESRKRIPVPPKLKRLAFSNKITIKALVEKENDITETREHDVESADVVELFSILGCCKSQLNGLFLVRQKISKISLCMDKK